MLFRSNGILWVVDKLMKGIDSLTRPFRFMSDLLAWVGKIILTFGKNVAIAIWNLLHPFKQKGFAKGPGAFSSTAFSAPLRGLTYEKLKKIDMSTLTTAGDTAQGGGTSGAGANYQAKKIVYNIVINADVIATDGGIDQVVLMFRNRLQQLEAAGY